MNVQTEQQLMQAIYDRLYNLLTVSPSGGHPPPFNAQTTLLQLQQPGQALNPADFANAVTPTHPMGDLLASENFSRLIDPVPAIGATYVATDVGIENTYGQIITSASAATSAPTQNVTATLPSQFNRVLAQALQIKTTSGATATVALPPPLAQAYDQAKSAYDKALNDYNAVLTSLDMTQPTDQHKWQVLAPPLQARVNTAYQAWRNAGASEVEGMNAAATASNSGVTQIIANDQRLFTETQLAGQYPGDTPWHLSYGMPSNWSDPDPMIIRQLFTHYELSSSNLNVSNTSPFVTLGGAKAFVEGLFSIDVKQQGMKQTITNHAHMEATNISIAMDLCLVRILRPWLNGLLLSLGGWYIGGLSKGAISTGNLLDGKDAPMKLIPMAFVVARNIEISGNLSQHDVSLIMSHDSKRGAIGWGPFQIGGTLYQPLRKTTPALTFRAAIVDQRISVPGLQIIAWISQVVPLCPPLDSPT
jgi:hypothetical protein